jgi:hypothetical protein
LQNVCVTQFPGVKLMTNHGGGNFKNSLPVPISGACVALVLGESKWLTAKL